MRMSLFGGGTQKEFGEMLEMTGYRKSVKRFYEECLALGAIAGVGVLYYGLFAAQSGKVSMLAIIAFFAPLVLNYFYRLYLFDERKKRVEEEVPDMLLLASSLPERMGLERIVGEIAKTGKGPLQEEFALAEKKIMAGMPIEQALAGMKARNKSRPLSRAIELITNALRSGAEMNSVFRETAQDFMETNSLLRERAANCATQKYTLLFAGGIIVPFILGTLTGMVSKLGFSGIAELGIGLSEIKKAGLIDASGLANIIYIAEYAAIASVFVAFQEGSQKKAVLYAMALLPCGLIAYFIGKGI